MCITEHWLRKCMDIQVEGYDIVSYFSREHSKHGGSLILAKKSLSKYLKACKGADSAAVESHSEISTIIYSKYGIICVYRPPSGDGYFFEIPWSGPFEYFKVRPVFNTLRGLEY